MSARHAEHMQHSARAPARTAQTSIVHPMSDERPPLTAAERRALVWHYTTGELLTKIAASGVIKPADEHISAGERPAVWFSTLTTWEPTASKGRADGGTWSVPDMIRKAKGLARIGVTRDVAPHDWRAFCRLSGITEEHRRALARTAKWAATDPAFWFVSFDPVPREKWAAVEVCHTERLVWEPTDFNAEIEQAHGQIALGVRYR